MSEQKSLTKWINLDELQALQDSFTRMSGVSCGIYDLDGNAITRKSGESDFCDRLVADNPTACSMCQKCRRYGAKETIKLGRSTFYYCHMGLLEFSSPIYVEGEIIGSYISGMVYEKKQDPEVVRQIALEYGIDPDALAAAAEKMPIMSLAQIEKTADFFYHFSSTISRVANGNIQLERASREAEIAARAKDDFLANMSHEIRTPMNAVIGLTDIALSENHAPNVSEYLNQIQSSGKTLLRIINDILDYSKITSGKMAILPEEYTLPTLLSEMSSFTQGRLHDKANEPIDFLLDASPSLPTELIGDVSRIRQILINITNNAIKFTHKGFIRLSVHHTQLAEDEVKLVFQIQDTGIGIRKEDLPKLFNSFYQADSKRNRNVEGTGLGLAIVQNLLTLMGGKISVESTYDVGSIFTIEIPQKVKNAAPIAPIPNMSHIQNRAYFRTLEGENQIKIAADTLGIPLNLSGSADATPLALRNWLNNYADDKCVAYVEDVPESAPLVQTMIQLLPEHNNLIVILCVNPFTPVSHEEELPNHVFKIKVPACSYRLADVYNTLLANLDSPAETVQPSRPVDEELHFTAPLANIMIVDDNRMNLRVAQKLLGLVGIQADLVNSGKECLDMIVQKRYDIIFMDHMMPELDGIDTTRLIRRFHPKYGSVPIIALSANAMENAREVFLNEGMNDFLAKPIEIEVLKKKLLKWLPPEKIVYEKQ